MGKVLNISILGRRWRLRFANLQKVDGDCDPPDHPGKEIRIARGLTPQREMEIVIHEFLHGADWTKDENDWIKPVARDLQRLLWRLGYRKLTPGESNNVERN